MANAARAEEQSTQQVEAPEKDRPLLDLSDAAVKKFIKTAKARGYVTYDELNAVLPSEEVSSEQIEDIMSMLSDMGITVVESEDHEEGAAAPDDEEGADGDEGGGRAVATAPPVPSPPHGHRPHRHLPPLRHREPPPPPRGPRSRRR